MWHGAASLPAHTHKDAHTHTHVLMYGCTYTCARVNCWLVVAASAAACLTSMNSSSASSPQMSSGSGMPSITYSSRLPVMRATTAFLLLLLLKVPCRLLLQTLGATPASEREGERLGVISLEGSSHTHRGKKREERVLLLLLLFAAVLLCVMRSHHPHSSPVVVE